MLLEVPMCGSTINIAAEAVVEYSAYGRLLERQGNRSPFDAPQGVYLSVDTLPDGRNDRWVLISAATDLQWRALAIAIGRRDLADDPSLATVGGRRVAHDALDEILRAWCATRTRDEIVSTLWPAGVAVAEATLGHEFDRVEQLQARDYLFTVEHPIHGALDQIGFPLRMSGGPPRLIHRHAPLLGEHNVEVLQGILGLTDDELAELEAARVIGTAAVQPDQTWSV